MNKSIAIFMLISTIILINIVPNPLFSAEPYGDAGSCGFSFLKIRGTTKSYGMGGTGVASGESFGINPAGYLDSLQKIGSSYQYLILSTHIGNIYYQKPFNFGKLQFSISYLTSPGIDKRDELGNDLGEFGYSVIVPEVNYALKVMPDLDVGICGKFLYSSVDEYNATAIAVGLGARYHVKDFPGLTIGAMADNLGTQLSAYDTEKDNLPITFSGGVSYQQNLYQLNFDLYKAADTRFLWAIGVEGKPHQLIALRFGYNAKGSEWKTGGSNEILGGMTFGCGLSWRNFNFDYAVVPMVDLGWSHHIGISMYMN